VIDSESIFLAENDEFFLSTAQFRAVNDRSSYVNKWNTDFDSCYLMGTVMSHCSKLNR